MSYKIKIEPEAHLDIQDGISWYNSKQKGLGRRFHKEVFDYFEALKTNPFYEIKYDTIRCLPLKVFPYTIHFSIIENDKIVIIRAVFQTSLDPSSWKGRI